MRDVEPPRAQPAQHQPTASPLKPEIVQDIPVKNQLGATANSQQLPANSPVAKVFKSSRSPTDIRKEDKRNEDDKKTKMKEAHYGSPPIVATILACLVAAALMAAAFYVYRAGF